MASKLVVKSLDHLVLTVKSIPATVDFYTKVLGMKHETFRSPKDVSIERYVNISLALVPVAPSSSMSGLGFQMKSMPGEMEPKNCAHIHS